MLYNQRALLSSGHVVPCCGICMVLLCNKVYNKVQLVVGCLVTVSVVASNQQEPGYVASHTCCLFWMCTMLLPITWWGCDGGASSTARQITACRILQIKQQQTSVFSQRCLASWHSSMTYDVQGRAPLVSVHGC